MINLKNKAMNRFCQTILSAVLMVTVLGCSKDKPQTIEALITTTVTFEDKAFDAPEGKVMLFDITEAELKSNYLYEAGGVFALTDKNDKKIFPYDTKNLGQYDVDKYSRSILFSSYVDDEFSHLPKKMLLYIYIEKPTSDHKDMYSFTEINVGEKNFELNKSFPAIVAAPLEYNNEYIKW